MAGDDDDDPFASVAKFCHIPSSQEVILRNCAFAREFEVFPEDNDGVGDDDDSSVAYGTPVESTGIAMFTLPETPNDEVSHHEDEFQTPPEQNQLASSEEQPIAIVDDDGDVTVGVDGGCTDGRRMVVDLGEDLELDPGFSGTKSRIEGDKNVLGQSPSKIMKQNQISSSEEQPSVIVVGDGDVTVGVDGGCTDGRRMVDLGEDLELDPGFSGTKSRIEGDKNVLDQSPSKIMKQNQISSSEEQPTVIVVGDDGDETVAVNGGRTDGKKMVYLGKELDPGFSVTKSTLRVDGDKDVLDQSPSKRMKLSQENHATAERSRARAEIEAEESEECIITNVKDSESKEVGPCNYKTTEDSESKEVGPCKYKTTESLVEDEVICWDGPTEVIESELPQSHRVVGFSKVTEKENSAMMDVCADKELQSNIKNVDDNEKLKNVASNRVGDGKRRALPPSICGQIENGSRGEELGSSITRTENKSVDYLLKVMKVLAERCEPNYDNVDLLETAKRRGMTFPRPSWWPEGFGEE